jgi:hypothetical protein
MVVRSPALILRAALSALPDSAPAISKPLPATINPGCKLPL